MWRAWQILVTLWPVILSKNDKKIFFGIRFCGGSRSPYFLRFLDIFKKKQKLREIWKKLLIYGGFLEGNSRGEWCPGCSQWRWRCSRSRKWRCRGSQWRWTHSRVNDAGHWMCSSLCSSCCQWRWTCSRCSQWRWTCSRCCQWRLICIFNRKQNPLQPFHFQFVHFFDLRTFLYKNIHIPILIWI